VAQDPIAIEHGSLLGAAENIVGRLVGLRDHLESLDDTDYLQHHEFCDRAWSLHTYLDSALVLARHDLYMAAFAILRSAMEHHIQDLLLFLANRYLAPVLDASDETLDEWEQAIAESQEEFAGILEIRRSSRGAQVVRTGPHFTGQGVGPDAPSLSRYYRVILEFDPFTGGKQAQGIIRDWPMREDAQRRRVAIAAEVWRRNLTWSQLMSNVLLNEFYTEDEVARWELHFSFLSAFTHPTWAGLNLIYGHNSPRQSGYDHYASELILLYVLTLARLELEAFETMTHRVPRVRLVDWDGVRLAVDQASHLASHLWFPTGEPHTYDRVQEANRRGIRANGSLIPHADRTPPEELLVEQVGYYSNPLRRIIALHANRDEMTGRPYRTPWPRQDAFSRLHFA
jgi:hypothetical protein